MEFTDFGVAFGLVLVIEGTLYALFPNAMRRVMLEALSLPQGQVRIAALVTAALGLGVVWLIRA